MARAPHSAQPVSVGVPVIVRKLETREDVIDFLDDLAGIPRSMSRQVGPRAEALIEDILTGNPALFGEDDDATAG